MRWTWMGYSLAGVWLGVQVAYTLHVVRRYRQAQAIEHALRQERLAQAARTAQGWTRKKHLWVHTGGKARDSS